MTNKTNEKEQKKFVSNVFVTVQPNSNREKNGANKRLRTALTMTAFPTDQGALLLFYPLAE